MAEAKIETQTGPGEPAVRWLIESSPVVHYMARAAANYGATYISDGVRAVTGYEPEQFTQDPEFWVDRIHPDDRSRVLTGFEQIFRTGRQQHEYRFRHADGRWLRMHDDATLVRDEARAPLAIVGAWLDISGRKQVEASLAREKAFSESLIKTAPTIILLLDPDGRIALINPYMEQISGYRADEVVGRDWFTTFLPECDRPDIRSLFAEVMEAGVNPGHTNPIVAKDGTWRQIEWHSKALVGEDGQMVALLNIGHDVTERIEYEDALRQARQEAEQADRAKSRFLAAAGHDLRQPLQSAGIYLSVLSRQLEQLGQREVCDKLRKSLDAMGNTLDALLDISKLDSGSIKAEKRDFRIQELLDRVVTDNEQQAEAKGLELVNASTDCTVHSDPALLERVIENFVTNAIRYTDRGAVTIGCSCDGGAAIISVSDTGIGVPKDALDKIFEEYCQLGNPARDRHKGLGLGLAIVKQIARVLDHRLDVESEPGKGSTFSVEVPLGSPLKQSVEPLAAQRSPRRDRNPAVLLVDDDPAIVDATTMFLESMGIRVHGASSGDVALAHVQSGLRPDIVVTDYRLPGPNGVEVVRRVRQATALDLPAVVMTGDTSAGEIGAALSNCAVLQKPVDTDKLVSLIEKLTEPLPDQVDRAEP